jgi:hypothetical protein
MPAMHISLQNNWLRGCWQPSGLLNWEDSEVTLAIGLNVPEMVNILKLAEYLASTSTYNIVLEV